ncbi:MAG: dockerin type I domain-containing protein [Methanospirillum sp.]
MDRSLMYRVVLALLVLASAVLVTPVLGDVIVSWGSDTSSQVSQTPTGAGFTAVAAGGEHSLALRADGSIVSWGRNNHNQVTDTPTGTGFTAIAAGGYHSLALRADGSIVSWGYDSFGQVSQTPGGTGFTAVAAGGEHSLALRADGSIVSWGRNDYGQVSQTPAGTGFAAVAAGFRHSVALRADGSIVSWGLNMHGEVSQTPTDDGYTAIAAGLYHTVALRRDSAIVSWGSDDAGEVSQTPTDAGYTAIAAGGYHSLALRRNGSIASWGSDTFGQVSQTPTGAGLAAVAAGDYSSVALHSPAPGIDLEANVSVDGGATWLDADSATGPTLLPGGAAPRFRFAVTNTGNVPLSNVRITDSVLGTIGVPGTLAVNGSAESVMTGSWVAGQQTNVATASGTGAGQTVSDSDATNYFGAAPAIDVEQEVSVDDGWSWLDADTAPGPNCGSGFSPRFRFMIENTGNVELSNVVLSDDVCGAIVLGSIGMGGGMSIGSITAPWHQGQYTNVATVNGSFTDDAGTTASISDSDAGNYFGIGPSVRAVPPGTALPTDTNGDGLYDDVNGNGRKDFADVVLFFNQLSWIATNEPMAAFDCNDNGRIDFADVVWLFNHL